jgi:hypothetical protein
MFKLSQIWPPEDFKVALVPFWHVLWFLVCFQTGSRSVTQAGPEITILLLWPPEWWDYRCSIPRPPYLHLFKKFLPTVVKYT